MIVTGHFGIVTGLAPRGGPGLRSLPARWRACAAAGAGARSPCRLQPGRPWAWVGSSSAAPLARINSCGPGRFDAARYPPAPPHDEAQRLAHGRGQDGQGTCRLVMQRELLRHDADHAARKQQRLVDRRRNRFDLLGWQSCVGCRELRPAPAPRTRLPTGARRPGPGHAVARSRWPAG